MEDIAKFIKDYIQAEFLAHQLQRQTDIASYNFQVDVVNSFLDPDLISDFGMRKLDAPKPVSFYEKMKHAQPITPRYLFKIDLIEDVNPLYRVFLSQLSDTKSYFDCLLIKKEIDKWYFFSLYTWGYGRPSTVKKRWYHVGGEELDFDSLKTKETLRLMSPEDEKESVEEYMKNN